MMTLLNMLFLKGSQSLNADGLSKLKFMETMLEKMHELGPRLGVLLLRQIFLIETKISL